MKWLSIIVIITILGTRCNKDCDDCGDLSRINYALKNELGDEINIRFWGEDNFDFQLNIPELDTSSIWSVTIDPTVVQWNYVLLKSGFENSFPGNVDSVYIFHENIFLKKWIREDDLLTQNLESIFSFESYKKVEKDLYLFQIDSLKLGLE